MGSVVEADVIQNPCEGFAWGIKNIVNNTTELFTDTSSLNAELDFKEKQLNSFLNKQKIILAYQKEIEEKQAQYDNSPLGRYLSQFAPIKAGRIKATLNYPCKVNGVLYGSRLSFIEKNLNKYEYVKGNTELAYNTERGEVTLQQPKIVCDYFKWLTENN